MLVFRSPSVFMTRMMTPGNICTRSTANMAWVRPENLNRLKA